MADATVKVSLTDVEPVMDLVVAGVRLYEALYRMPGAAEFLTKTAPRDVVEAYGAMGQLVRHSPLRAVKNPREESA